MTTNKSKFKKWLKKLKPFLLTREKAYRKFSAKEYKIEQEMKKQLGENLEFFYVDGECVGIGHSDWKRRKKGKKYFPLLQNDEIESGEFHDYK